MLIASIFVVFVITLKAGNAVPVECRFESHSDGYNCEIISFFPENNLPMTSIKGNHKNAKNDSNVEVLFIRSNLNTRYVPIQSCVYLKKLIKFDIGSKTIKEIARNVFESCGLVETIEVVDTVIVSLPEDLLNDVINLTWLDMHNNQLAYLPNQLFAMNAKLRKINFEGNRLAIINAVMPNTLIKISFRKNVCIDKNYPGDFTAMNLMLTALRENCNVPAVEKEKTELRAQVTELKAKVADANDAARQFKVEKEKQETELTKDLANRRIQSLAIDKLQSNFATAAQMFQTELRRMQTNITLMSIENSEKSKEIQLLTSNHSTAQDKIELLFTEVIQLKQNASLTEFQLADKGKSLKTCTSEKVQLNETVAKLNASLSSLKMEKDAEVAQMHQHMNASDNRIDKLTSELSDARTNLSLWQSTETTQTPGEGFKVRFAHLKITENNNDAENSFFIKSCALIAFLTLGWLATVVYFIRQRYARYHSAGHLDMEALTTND